MNSIRLPVALARRMRAYRMTRPRLDALVDRRLKRTLKSARDHVPFYRAKMLEAGLGPGTALVGLADLSRIPITTKAEIKRVGVDRARREGVDPSTCHLVQTSGSTGIPLEILRSPSERAEQVALWVRTLLVNGYSFRQRVLALRGPNQMGEGRSILQHIGLLRREVAHYQMPPGDVVDILLAQRPDVLYGNRNHMENLCSELRRRNTRCDFLKLLVCGGAPLYEKSREFMRKWLGANPVDSYGTEESGVIAHETPDREGLRICEDTVVVEFLDENDQPVPPGVPGRVVITTLGRHVQPFIRYDLGDRAVHKVVEDSNGVPWRRIETIKGRDNDFMVLPDGSRRNCPEFYNVLAEYPDLEQGRAIQRAVNRIELQLVGDPTYIEKSWPGILQYLRSRFPPEMEFVMVRKETLEPDPSGKLQIFRNEVQDLHEPESFFHHPSDEWRSGR